MKKWAGHHPSLGTSKCHSHSGQFGLSTLTFKIILSTAAISLDISIYIYLRNECNAQHDYHSTIKLCVESSCEFFKRQDTYSGSWLKSKACWFYKCCFWWENSKVTPCNVACITRVSSDNRGIADECVILHQDFSCVCQDMATKNSSRRLGFDDLKSTSHLLSHANTHTHTDTYRRTSHRMWHVIIAAIRGVVTGKLKSPNISVVVKHFPHLPDDIPLWAPVTARRAFALPNEETESSVIHSAGSTAAQRTAVWRGWNMTGHDTTPCTLEEVLSTVGGGGCASCALMESCRQKDVLFDHKSLRTKA